MESSAGQVNKCKNCGAELGTAVNGVNTCGYCGSAFKSANTIDADAVPVSDDEQYLQADNVMDSSVQAPMYGNPFSKEQQQINDYSFLIPTRGKLFKRYALRSLIFWVAFGIIRAVLPTIFGKKFEVDATYYNNLIISPIGRTYWFIRAALFVLIFPGIITLVKYKRKNRN